MLKPEPTYPNWFAHYAVRFFERHLSPLAGRPGLRFLQIGAFTGDASVWLLENILTGAGSVLYDVDTWEGSDEPEHIDFDWTDVHRVYDAKVAPWVLHWKAVPCWMPSAEFLDVEDDESFDFVYVDGDHTAPAVLADALGAFRILAPGGLLAFDDYLWKPSDGGGPTRAPGVAVDAFAAVYEDRLEVLETGLQVWFRKLP